MKTMLSIVGVLAGCGEDTAVRPDALMPGVPVLTVMAPRLNEAFYMTQTATVAWTVTDDAASTVCDVTARDGATMIPIAVGVTAITGAAMTTPWALTAVAPAENYVVEVSCTDDSSPPLFGMAASGTFSVAGAPQPVSYAAQVQPIWDAKCTSNACHDSTLPQERLNLTPSASRTALVGVASRQCTTTQLVAPGNPDQSYLMFKLQGSGPCMMGSRMPKAAPTLTTAQRQLVRDWIANGAPNN